LAEGLVFKKLKKLNSSPFPRYFAAAHHPHHFYFFIYFICHCLRFYQLKKASRSWKAF
jgi:hypothetical protein